MLGSHRVVIRGAGELASGVGVCLHSVGFQVVMTEISQPLAVRRGVSFAEAVYDGTARVEGISARRVESGEQAIRLIGRRELAVVVDPLASLVAELRPTALIDAIMAKRNVATRVSDSPIVIGLGPGFVAGRDAHAVIETHRGHELGRIIWEGTAQPDSGQPTIVMGQGAERVLRAPAGGIIHWQAKIGDLVQAGHILGDVGEEPILAPFAGALRGAIREGREVTAGMKIGDIDPRNDSAACFTISDKARAIGGATLQALLILMQRLGHHC